MHNDAGRGQRKSGGAVASRWWSNQADTEVSAGGNYFELMFKDLLGTQSEPASWPGRCVKTKNTALEKVEVVLSSCLQNDSMRLYTVSVFVALDKQASLRLFGFGDIFAQLCTNPVQDH